MTLTREGEHHVKIFPHYYEDVRSGIKKFEIRKDDRDYRVGDELYLNEFDPELNDTTGRYLSTRIIYLVGDPQYCKKGYVVLGIDEVQEHIG
ncbi:hypothetical protein BK125_04695 [Paenibacillus odorifer]|uniref:DUF3850 domain-containing protein n=1 Tax=Paenibacillus odorifer TaxID=189426 RepID=A0ABX3GQN2_9BACL|nr:DUF3850 domain-containing protein [Paenibacillus odorifer]OMC79582.1 hypothetical protein BK125_04695 [Paenibacillus odorifer]OMD34928.1 hypothetical protein BSO21_09940 [Paenibacillus odorifer]